MSLNTGLALPKKNYMFIIAGVVIVLIGFALMSGGGAEDPMVFDADELFSFRRITLAPATVMVGYIVILYGILKRRKEAIIPERNGIVNEKGIVDIDLT